KGDGSLPSAKQGGCLEPTKLVSWSPDARIRARSYKLDQTPLCHCAQASDDSLILVGAELQIPPTASCSRTLYACRAWGDPHARPAPRPRPPTLPARSAGPLRDFAALRFCAPRLLLRLQFADRWKQATPCQLARNRFHFLHDVSDHRTNSRIAHHLNQRGARQCADRIEGSVAQDLYPNLLPETSGDRAAQAGRDQRLRNSAATIGARAIRFAERNAVPLDVSNHSWCGDLGRKV